MAGSKPLLNCIHHRLQNYGVSSGSILQPLVQAWCLVSYNPHSRAPDFNSTFVKVKQLRHIVVVTLLQALGPLGPHQIC